MLFGFWWILGVPGVGCVGYGAGARAPPDACALALECRVYISGKALLPVLELVHVTPSHLRSKEFLWFKCDVSQPQFSRCVTTSHRNAYNYATTSTGML